MGRFKIIAGATFFLIWLALGIALSIGAIVLCFMQPEYPDGVLSWFDKGLLSFWITTVLVMATT